MEIVLPASSPLFSPLGAAGSSSKPGDGMMELKLHLKMEMSWTNRLVLPRAERPISRTLSLCEKTENTIPTGITSSVTGVATFQSVRFTEISTHSGYIVVLTSYLP
jgi:hypothetical protein